MYTQADRHHADRRLRQLLLRAAAIAALTVLGGGAVEAKPMPFRSEAKSIETSSDLVSLPAPGGTVVVARGCGACDPVSLSLATGTVYRIGNRNVSSAEFRDKARSGNYSMTVHYHSKTLEVLKIRLEAFD